MKKLNENPDTVGGYNGEIEGDPYASTALKGSRSPVYGDDDAITFTLFNNFYLYSRNPECTHGHLYQNLLFIINKEDHLVPEFWRIKYSGNLSEEEKKKIKNIYRDVQKVDRNPTLDRMPNAIQGRLWTESKIISFWNDSAQISSRKNDIINFIKMDIKQSPQKFQYEIKDILHSYDEFLSGSYNNNTKFDPTAIHTSPPEKKGEILKSMGAVPKSPVPLAYKQMIQGESFKNWLEQTEK